MCRPVQTAPAFFSMPFIYFFEICFNKRNISLTLIQKQLTNLANTIKLLR